MATVTISGNDYESYQSLDDANDYLAADITRGAAWVALASDDIRGSALVSASRLISVLEWEDEAPAFDLSGIEPGPAQAIAQATSVLAAELAADPDLANSLGKDRDIKGVKAGSVNVDFFYPRSGETLPMPRAVWQILKTTDLIGSADVSHGAPVFTGAMCQSRFEDDDYMTPHEIYGSYH